MITHSPRKSPSLIDYFKKGFMLTNRSLDIYLIGIAFASLSPLSELFKNTSLGILLSLCSFLAIFFTFGYQISIPLLLALKQQEKQFTLETIVAIILKNSKRLILPTVIFILLIILLSFISFALFFGIYHPASIQYATAVMQLTQQWKNWNPLFVVLGSVLATLAFTPIYFSIENKGLFSSMKQSIIFSCKHLNFIAILIILGIVISLLTNLIPNRFLIGFLISPHISLFLLSVVNQYLSLILTASILLFYQNYHKTPVITHASINKKSVSIYIILIGILVSCLIFVGIVVFIYFLHYSATQVRLRNKGTSGLPTQINTTSTTQYSPKSMILFSTPTPIYTGSISGIVVNNGKPVPNDTVELSVPQMYVDQHGSQSEDFGGVYMTTQTDTNGVYAFSNLAPNKYRVEVLDQANQNKDYRVPFYKGNQYVVLSGNQEITDYNYDYSSF